MPISGFDSLLPGDYVVHIDHGIAKFLGTERIQTMGIQQDCMVLEYQSRSKVYVPIEDFYKVQKYIGKDAAPPALSKLGTARWEKQKAKARESLREMAENLITLYAKRECFEGIAFSKDSVWQKEFEEAFIYDPTPDQTVAINDVKKDMESPKPMDRLVCGDVGFGKTEIAMRAAVKAALDGYQVAILAPTTILAAQHYTTFTERMANLPLNVAVLSRFLKSKEQREILKKLKNGSVDILIGTHRILSKDVIFKNLGLLIVDEEQRFGVRHKEKLKEYRYKVDVLSMTATPIPRTLHMSLIGIRDLSIINTPPRNRLPIETHVTEYHDEIIKESIENELERGGQIYVVHNRIQNLPQLQDRIEVAVPRARVAVAHGQMDEKLLERVMKEFIAGKFDVLLSTAIIENGLDIPNVNTIIVNRADILGLSQLYQLRGRVGRSAEQAFAYFLTSPFKEIKEVSLKRLRALEQYTDLGSGFQIAMRDLEIRGAGNILGTDQHGAIAAVGFDLYCRLLKEEIDVVMGRAPEEKAPEVKIDLPIDAYIPADYVSDSATRIALYQECSACKQLEDIQEIEKGFIDRFGPLPVPVRALIILIQMKILGYAINLSQISANTDNALSFSFQGTDETIAQQIKRILSTSVQQFEVVYGTPVILKTVLTSKTAFDKATEIKNILESCTSTKQ
jgi:transcription-repair coupling factor (superfamily II helicase)